MLSTEHPLSVVLQEVEDAHPSTGAAEDAGGASSLTDYIKDQVDTLVRSSVGPTAPHTLPSWLRAAARMPFCWADPYTHAIPKRE